MNMLLFDIEATGLLDEQDLRIHCICDQSGEVSYEEWLGRLMAVDIVVGHNILGYDLPLLSKLHGFKYDVDTYMLTSGGIRVRVLDTLVLSRLIWPDRPGGHGLLNWSKQVGTFKPEIECWKNLSHDQYVHRCNEDVKTTEAVLNACLKETGGILGRPELTIVELFDYWKLPMAIDTHYTHIMSKQEIHGVRFNIELAKQTVRKLDEEMEAIKAKWEPTLPQTKSKKGDLNYPPKKQMLAPPKHPYKKTGGLTKAAQDYLAKSFIKTEKLDEAKVFTEKYLEWCSDNNQKPTGRHTDPVNLTKNLTLDNDDGIKQYLIDHCGWRPTIWNYKLVTGTKSFEKGPDGKPIRTTPRIREKAGAKNLCPHLESLQAEFAKDYIYYLTLKHRRQTIKSPVNDEKGWLNHQRLKIDGRLPAGYSGSTNCFTADTLILTENGHRYWADIKVGDRVLTHKDRMMPVTDVFENGLQEVYKVTLENGIETKVTGNHCFLVNDIFWGDDKKLEWVRADELEHSMSVFAYPEKEEWAQWRDEPILVSSWGRVQSLKSGKMYKSRAAEKEGGRQIIDIGLKDGKFRSFRAARLVLEAFKGLGKDTHCLHKNDVPFDDHISNLYEGTDYENAQDKKKYGIHEEARRKNSKISNDDVELIKQGGKLPEEFAKIFGVTLKYIKMIQKGQRRVKRTIESKEFSVELCQIKAVQKIGKRYTYGIAVDEDESHLTDGIFTHNTHRVKHRCVANVPKVSAIYGKEMRGMFCV